ncbi:MAG: hypothetical protein K2O70_09880, partial [Desulfovibrionaceae bacterium]|nr:hypothetical protein [Desulfovibrionaceae bacterium]
MSNATKKVSMETGRREVLKAAAVLVAAPILVGGISGVGMAAESGSAASGASGPATGKKSALDLPLLTKKRTLGSGKFSMEVSALGFGVM